MTEHCGSCVKELEILRAFQTWSCLYKARSRSRSKREEREERRTRRDSSGENIREYRKKKRVLSTSLCRQLWSCHRHLWTSWSCSLLDQDLLWDRAKLLGLPSPFCATALPWTTSSDHQDLRNLQTFGPPLISETKDSTVYYWDIAVLLNPWASQDDT